MDVLLNLVRSMQTGELKMLRHFYRMQDNDNKKKNLLLESLIKWKNCKFSEDKEEKAMLLLYGKTAGMSKAFERTKSRLKSDITNILLLEGSPDFKSRYEIALFECRTMTLQGDILLGRALYHEGMALLDKAGALAAKYQLYPEQLLIDNIQSTYSILEEEEEEYLAHSIKIRNAGRHVKEEQQAKDVYDELVALDLFRSMNKKPLEEYENTLKLIHQNYLGSHAVRLGFYYRMSSLYLYRIFGDYEKAMDFALELLKEEERQEIYHSRFISGNIHLETARCFLLTGEYDNAIYHAQLSSRRFGLDMFNVLRSCEILFHCYRHLDDHKKAIKVFEEVQDNPFLKKDDFAKSKWLFFRASLYFSAKEYREAVQLLKDCNLLMRDKTGWMLGCVFFETVCRIETGNLDFFELRMEGIRKLMQRYNRGQIGHQNKRFAIIYNILKTLNKNTYDFGQTVKEEQENIKLLASGKDGYAWSQEGCEPVRFDAWILSKAENQPKRKNDGGKLVA